LQGYWLFFGRVDLGSTWFFHAPVPTGTTRDNFDFEDYLQKAVGAEFDIELDYVGFWDLRIALTENYRNGRVFVAGDAAHSHPPYGGYGINTGFEDVRNLGWKLAARLQGWGSDRLLDSYDEERRPVFASTADHFIERFIREDRDFLNTYSPEDDQAVFEHAWNTRNEGSSEVMAFAPNYDGSSIVFGTKDASPSARGSHEFFARAGHHLAPQILSDGVNAFEKLGPGFTLFALGADDVEVAAFREASETRNIPLTICRDALGAASEGWQARFVLVRPDQYVAWAARDIADTAAAVLDHICGLD
jgi:hypothetical protein